MASAEAAAGARQYLIVTAAYWAFTLSDGALRMLVLLHFHRLGFSPLALAYLFLLYEAAGVFANLFGGWLATRYGLSRLLLAGLCTQCLGFVLLCALDPHWQAHWQLLWVLLAQGICGVAKDLSKTAAKSAIKLTRAGGGALFQWVAWFTGGKNAMKGAGFFLGGALLASIGFAPALWAMTATLAAVALAAALTLPARLGAGRAARTVRELFAKTPALNRLAAARLALFAARDVWFVVGVPLFLIEAGWSTAAIGAALALWTIGYGLSQGLAPHCLPRSADGCSAEVPALRGVGAALLAITAALWLWARTAEAPTPLGLWLGLTAFGLAFALASSLHSYLVLAWAGSAKAAEDVGFYYAANALGRLLGTLLSGLLYQWQGLSAVLAGAGVLLLVQWLISWRLPARAAAGR